LKAFDYPYDEDSMCMLSIFFDVAHYLERTSAISMINDNSDDINPREDEKERKRPVRNRTRGMTSTIEGGSSECKLL